MIVTSVLLPLGNVFAVPIDLPRIGEVRSTHIRLDANHTSDAIHTTDAAFIKVHIAHFSLPDGMTLEIASPDGKQVYRYRHTHLDSHTVSHALGQDGVTSFSAVSIFGPTAVLRLKGTAQSPWLPSQGVVVTHYLEGYPESELLPQPNPPPLSHAPREICGEDLKQPAVCYKDSDPMAFDRSRPVARMVFEVDGIGHFCTAWRVGPDNRLFTNNHCASTQDAIAGAEFWFNYQRLACDINISSPVTIVTGARLLSTDRGNDYTLFEVNDFDRLQPFGYLGLDISEPHVNADIFIAGHPGGRMKELSVFAKDDKGNLEHCRIDDMKQPTLMPTYRCDTEIGNSGSPVIARTTGRSWILHHTGYACENQGTPMEWIWPAVSTYFNGVVPKGDNEQQSLHSTK
jgi:V8-like Glu-specific endopeptidase